MKRNRWFDIDDMNAFTVVVLVIATIIANLMLLAVAVVVVVWVLRDMGVL